MFSEIPYPAGISFLGRHGISSFSLMLMAAFVSALYIVRHDLRRRGLRVAVADGILLWSVVGSIVGSKVFFIFEIWERIWVVELGFWDTFYRVFFTWSGMQHAGGESLWGNFFSGSGLVFYGGFTFACLALYLYFRFSKVSVWQYADSAVLGLAIGYAWGRLGCFVSGDGCFGHAADTHIPLFTWIYGPEGGCPSDSALSWKYPYICTDGVAVWNTPVMEALVSIGFFVWALSWGRHQNFRPGMLLAIFMIVNGLARLLVEFIRLNDAVIPILDPPTVITGDSETVLPHHLADRYDGIKPGESYFANWRWYGFTQSQLFALLIMMIASIWIWKGKLQRRDGFDASLASKKPPQSEQP